MSTNGKSGTVKHSPEFSKRPCPSCLSTGVTVFHELKHVPVHSVMNIRTREEALGYPKGDICLGFCRECGFIYNLAFDPALLQYSSNCEESQGFSPTFNEFAHRLALSLIEKYGLRNKRIVEIGCGKGEFLNLICKLGGNRGVGFDPAYVEGRSASGDDNRAIFIKDFYSEKYSDYVADLICCRMTLEHISDTKDFVHTIRRSIGNRLDTIVFFQVPDATRILRDCAFEDIYYEHCSYFSPGSLARLFRNCGFQMLNLRTNFGDQYLLLEAKPAADGTKGKHLLKEDLTRLEEYVRCFEANCQKKLSFWEQRLQGFKENGERTVLWGSGSKAVAFLTTLKIFDAIQYVVDINPHKQGCFMAGTGQEIVTPEFLKELDPDVIIIMNQNYLDEVKRELDRMGLDPDVFAL